MTSLEDLPDELFLEIFSYLSPTALFHSFAHLNDRFNSILCDPSVELGIQLTNDSSSGWIYFLDYFTVVQICCDQIDLRRFSSVRSLILGPSPRPTEDLLYQLIDQPQRDFPYLQQLIIYQPIATWYSIPAIQFWTNLFTNQFSPRLEFCTLPGRIFAIPTTRFCCHSLRQLSIGGCSLRDLPALLAVVPNLESLCTELWGITDRANASSYYHSQLRHLQIRFTQQTIEEDEIHCLLTYTPYLRRLTIEGTRKHEMFDVEEWYDILTDQLKYLQRFYCTIHLRDSWLNENLDIDSIRQHHRFFSHMRLIRQYDHLMISNQ